MGSENPLCRYVLDEAELEEALRQHNRASLRRPILRLGYAVVVLLLVLLTISFVTKGFRIGPFLVGAVLAFLFFVLPPALRHRNRSRLRKVPYFGAEIAFTLTEAGLELVAPGFAPSTLNWTAFSRTLRGRNGFLLYSPLGSFTWLPFRGFGGDPAISKADALLRLGVSAYATVA